MSLSRLAAVLAATTTAFALTVAGSGAGASAGAESPRPAFYEAPATLPKVNGDLIRSEKLDVALDWAEAFAGSYTATRVLYRSTNRAGAGRAVSGSVLVPTARWVGLGKRPVIGYAVGSQGIGDACAPSRQLSDGIESDGFAYEPVFVAGLLARGYAVAMTDYEGLGTSGKHTYLDRVSQGRAVIDVVRAAQRMPSTGLNAETPVAFVGYSQGGAAAASAAELAGSYAPEMKVKGTVASAVPADVRVLPDAIDGNKYAAFTWLVMAGLASSYDIDETPYLNQAGEEFFSGLEDVCVSDLLATAIPASTQYTADGASLGALMTREPFKQVIADQRIGRHKPNAPVLITHSLFDDVIPYAVGQQLATDWCDRGGKVRLSANITPGHAGAMLNHVAEMHGFLEARFAGLPASGSCWRL